MREMFDRAWESLPEEERARVEAERAEWMGAYSGSGEE